jgi:hypothetical protein
MDLPELRPGREYRQLLSELRSAASMIPGTKVVPGVPDPSALI